MGSEHVWNHSQTGFCFCAQNYYTLMVIYKTLRRNTMQNKIVIRYQNEGWGHKIMFDMLFILMVHPSKNKKI